MLEKYPKDVKVVIKHFPLPNHNFARKAAIAALAAGAQGKFWEYSEKNFELMRDLNDDKFREIAIDLGLDLPKFNKTMNDPVIHNLIDRDLREGRAAGVRGTPTIFINGKLLNNRSIQGFQQMIDMELEKFR